MANLIFASAGGDATIGTQEWTTITGTVTIDGTVASPTGYTGPCRIKCDGGAGAAATVRKSGIHVAAGRRGVVWFLVPALPTTNAEIYDVINSGNSATTFRILLLTSGLLQLHSGNTTNGTTTIQINTWYRLALSYTVTSTTVHSARVYLGTNANPTGALEISETNNGTLPSAVPDIQFLGWNSTPGSGNKIIYFNSFFLDDGTDLADPGNVLVTYKAPTTSNVSTNFSNIGTGAVNERALSTTNGRLGAAATICQNNYNIEAAGVGDVNISTATYKGYVGWIWAARVTGTAGTPTDNITVNGVDTAIITTTTAAYYSAAATSASYPSNAAGIGLNRTAAGTQGINWYEGGVLVAYIPGAGGATHGLKFNTNMSGLSASGPFFSNPLDA